MARLSVLAAVLAVAAAQYPDTPQGGANCTTDWECSLGGVCTTGACVCDVWFTGPACDLLNLAPAEPNQGLQVPGYHSWGGHSLLNPKDGLYHGFYSFMCNGSTLGSWTTKVGLFVCY